MSVNLDIVKNKIKAIDGRIDDGLLDLLYYYFVSRYCVDQINKQPKDNKVKEIINGAYFYCFCPFCGELILGDCLSNEANDFVHHCKTCGAKLDWSDSILYQISTMLESHIMEESFCHEY